MTDRYPFVTRFGGNRDATPHPCTKPPAGWVCTRTAGHEGSCTGHQLGDLQTEGAVAIPARNVNGCQYCGTCAEG